MEIKYRDVVETLRKDILSGKYSLQSPFPSVAMIMRRFGISNMTAVKVMDKLKHEGLIASYQGRGTFVTKMGSNRQIGLIAPGVAYSEFFQPIVVALSGVCMENGYGLSVGSAFSSDGTERARQALAFAHDLAEKRVSGVIFQPIESIPNAPRVNKQILAIFAAAKIPVVLLDSDVVPMPQRSDYDVIGVNNFDAGRRLAVHLLSAGARRICFVTMPHPCYSIRNRFAGVQSVLASHGMLLKSMTELDATSEADVRRLLRKEKPDAILCCCDTFAAYVKCSLEKLGKVVPRDLLLAGFDDVQHATIMTPALTTARQPCEKIAREAFCALVERMKNPKMPPREILLTAPLVVRSSTRRVKSVKRVGRNVAGKGKGDAK